MKTFEHEVLTFSMGGTKDKKVMTETLREWGASGFEIVGVVQTNDTTPVTVFLKREVLVENDQGEGVAA